MKTQDLQGVALDWAVAKCEGETVVARKDGLWIEGGPLDDHDTYYSPSTLWDQGGPTIEREGIGTMPTGDAAAWVARGWDEVRMDFIYEYGPTPLVAAMRLYVKTKIGSDIDIPPDILKGD